MQKIWVCDGENDCGGNEAVFFTAKKNICHNTAIFFSCPIARRMKETFLFGKSLCFFLDETDERNCTEAPPGAPCKASHFVCETGDQCYPRNFQCDGTNDCQDGSDEIGCAGPTITVPPVSSQEVRPGDTVTIQCEAVGFPVPLISWRLNWGNVPGLPRVTVSSQGGVGILTIRNFQESDQGAYRLAKPWSVD